MIMVDEDEMLRCAQHDNVGPSCYPLARRLGSPGCQPNRSMIEAIHCSPTQLLRVFPTLEATPPLSPWPVRNQPKVESIVQH